MLADLGEFGGTQGCGSRVRAGLERYDRDGACGSIDDPGALPPTKILNAPPDLILLPELGRQLLGYWPEIIVHLFRTPPAGQKTSSGRLGRVSASRSRNA